LITQQCRIGRNPSNDLVINDRAAEDFHAVIMLSDENLIFIEDQSSRYGTMVNGERISKTQLFPGDEVQIGFCRIDWESRTGFQPSLNEIEVIPNLSVPIKRPLQHNAALADMQSPPHLNQLNKGDASLALANSLLENEAQMDRIENSISQDEAIDTSQTSNETTISTIEMTNASDIDEAIPEIHVSEIDQDNVINTLTNQSDLLPINESIDEDVDLNNEGKSENVSSENYIPLNLHQKLDQIETPIITDYQSNEEPIESNISDESNSTSPVIPWINNDSIIEQERTSNSPLNKIADPINNNWIRNDSVQIALAIALTFLLLAAGWFIGQAS
jgi:pSer/pThr/pTyr-binding forkhead associated (FHA) protein